jgi:hypothetical protein
MVQLSSLLSSDSNSATGQVAHAAPDKSGYKSGHDEFRDVLSEASDPGAETASGHESLAPASWDKFARVAPPAPASSSAGADATGSTSAGEAESDSDPFMQLVNSTSAANAAANSSTSAASGAAAATSTALTAQQAFDDAYWAAQPAAVQALRTAPADERVQMATQLAQEGYSIDVPIMVWGWDPYTTTNTREADGYTWVPSALQSSVAAAPGIAFDGTSYNASDPPAGSIAV